MHRFLYLFLVLPAVVYAGSSNVLLITIDTLRADHLGCYGNKTVRTPNLDLLAKESLFFENAICPAPLTLPSHTSLMTGRYPFHHGVVDNAGSVNARELTLAEILHARGYHTYAFVGGFPLDHRFGLNQGFDIYDDSFPRQSNQSLDFRSERGADQVLKAVQSVKIQEPYFVWVHFYDPHAPYQHGGYAGEIEFVDQQVGLLLKHFAASNPVIAVAGDHGESLGEHGEWTHRIFVYDSTVRVPLWIRGPGISAARIKGQVRLIDFLPTILRILKVPTPPNLDGVLQPDHAGISAYVESRFAQLQLGWSPLFAIRTEEWKYVEAPHAELYNLRTDPGEKSNVYAKNPEIVKKLRSQIPPSSILHPPSSISPEMAEKLASLGYVSGSSNAGNSNIDPKDRIGVWNEIEKAVDLESTRPEETIVILERARKADPDNPMVLGFLAQKYAESNRLDEAKQILQQVLTHDPKNTLALYRIAVVCLKQGQVTEAKKWAESLKVLEPGNADAWILVARANLKLKDPNTAATNLKKALDIDPQDQALRIDLANLYMQMGNMELARANFETARQADPGNLQALNGLATCSFTAGDLAAAEALLKKALQGNPKDVQTKMNLALLYSKQGKKAEATALYREVAASAEAPADWRAEARARLQEME